MDITNDIRKYLIDNLIISAELDTCCFNSKIVIKLSLKEETFEHDETVISETQITTNEIASELGLPIRY